MPYLSYRRDRRRPWTEHENFPKGAIAYKTREDNSKYKWNPNWKTADLAIYEMSDDRTEIRLVPQSEWSQYLD